MMEAWTSLPAEVRSALVQSELANSSTGLTHRESSISLGSSISGSDEGNSNNSEFEEEDAKTGAKLVLKPLERAPKNVFSFVKTSTNEKIHYEKKPASTVTTKTTVVTTSKGWRNVFSLPISYDVNLVEQGTLLDPSNPQLLDATGVHPAEYNRRFAVLDEAVEKLYGDKIRQYFAQRNIDLHYIVLAGGEPEKRPMVSLIPTIMCHIAFLDPCSDFCISGR